MKTKCYVLVNSWLSGVQKGIQAAHAVADLVHDYAYEDQLVRQWVERDKTLVVLEGGTSKNIVSFYEGMENLNSIDIDVGVSVSMFSESESCLGGAATAVAFVAPEFVTDMGLTGSVLSDMMYMNGYSVERTQFFDIVKSARLAR